MTTIKLTGFLLALCLASGCASTSLPKDAIRQIPSISVNRDVAEPNQATFHGGGTNVANALGGALTVAIAKSGDIDKGTTLTAFLKQKNIDVPAIFSQQFLEQLARTPLSSKISDTGAYRFNLTVDRYGLGKGWGLQNNMRASIKGRVTLTDASGKVVWKKEGWVGGSHTEMEIHTIEEWLADPEGLKRAYTRTATILATELLKEFETK